MEFYVLRLVNWLVDKPAKAHKTIFASNNICILFFSNFNNKLYI
jgi:hypothetical protein